MHYRVHVVRYFIVTIISEKLTNKTPNTQVLNNYRLWSIITFIYVPYLITNKINRNNIHFERNEQRMHKFNILFIYRLVCASV